MRARFKPGELQESDEGFRVCIKAAPDVWRACHDIMAAFSDWAGTDYDLYGCTDPEDAQAAIDLLSANIASGETEICMEVGVFFDIARVVKTYEPLGYGQQANGRQPVIPEADYAALNKALGVSSNRLFETRYQIWLERDKAKRAEVRLRAEKRIAMLLKGMMLPERRRSPILLSPAGLYVLQYFPELKADCLFRAGLQALQRGELFPFGTLINFASKSESDARLEALVAWAIAFLKLDGPAEVRRKRREDLLNKDLGGEVRGSTRMLIEQPASRSAYFQILYQICHALEWRPLMGEALIDAARTSGNDVLVQAAENTLINRPDDE